MNTYPYDQDNFENELVNSDLFDSFMTETHLDDVRFNYCPDCKTPMELSVSEYQCTNCGITIKNEGDNYKDYENTTSPSIRATTGSYRGKYYHPSGGDYSRTQRKVIYEQLTHHAVLYKGSPFPPNILHATANRYNEIQKHITEEETTGGKKKFVRRGNIKNEVLGALLYFECISQGIARKKRDIAEFMKLQNGGFARGEDLIRGFEAEGLLKLPVNEEPISAFTDRYLEALGIENDSYSLFIKEIVDLSEQLKIGMNSQLSSKIVGVIWIIIVKCRLNISIQTLEVATDNTKKNTFMKFYKVVFGNFNEFAPIFTKYNIPN